MWDSTIGISVLLALGLLAAPLTAAAQPSTKVHRIGVLSWVTPRPETGPDVEVQALRQALHALGYVEGQNLVIEYRSAEGSQERLRDLAAELVRLQVEVIVPVGTPAIRVVPQATTTIPIVIVAVIDPVGAGLVASLARP